MVQGSRAASPEQPWGLLLDSPLEIVRFCAFDINDLNFALANVRSVGYAFIMFTNPQKTAPNCCCLCSARLSFGVGRLNL